MTQPVRIQLSRRRGFRLQEHSLALNGLPAVKVDRTTRWGNPLIVRCSRGRWRVSSGGRQLIPGTTREAATSWAVRNFERLLRDGLLGVTVKDVRRELVNSNLSCWCPIGATCHADVLLRVANGDQT